MNYRHIYHAGCFADVVKHITLIALLNNLCKKEAPYYVLDSFAGAGIYDLNSEKSLKTQEAEIGIKKIILYNNDLPELLSQYRDLTLKYYNGIINDKTKIYPGSPLIISEFLREQDHLDCSELHIEDYSFLKQSLKFINNASSHNIDAYKAFKALLPPKQKRGLIFIDPPFEEKDEFTKIQKSLSVIYKKFNQATTMIWYPIKDYKIISKFYQELEVLYKEVLKIEFGIYDASTSLCSAGIIIINPPFIKDIMEINLKFLQNTIYKGRASYNISFI